MTMARSWIDAKIEADALARKANAEMVRQNNLGSLKRCYHAADRMYAKVRELEAEARRLKGIPFYVNQR